MNTIPLFLSSSSRFFLLLPIPSSHPSSSPPAPNFELDHCCSCDPFFFSRRRANFPFHSLGLNYKPACDCVRLLLPSPPSPARHNCTSTFTSTSTFTFTAAEPRRVQVALRCPAAWRVRRACPARGGCLAATVEAIRHTARGP